MYIDLNNTSTVLKIHKLNVTGKNKLVTYLEEGPSKSSFSYMYYFGSAC